MYNMSLPILDGKYFENKKATDDLKIERYKGFNICVMELENPFNSKQEILTKNPTLGFDTPDMIENLDRLSKMKLWLAIAENDDFTIRFQATKDSWREAGKAVEKYIDAYAKGMQC